MKSIIVVVSLTLAATLLNAQDVHVVGYWNGGGKEVYTEGNEHYCFKPLKDSSATFELDAKKNNLKSCIYLMSGSIVAKSCTNDPTLSLSNLDNTMYKVVVAPYKKSNNVKYVLNVSFDGQFSRCNDYYTSGYLGMTQEDLNLILALSGVLTALLFFGSITYVILTLGNF